MTNKGGVTQITLNIPDSELDFFMRLKSKFNYTTSEESYVLTSEMKENLDERLEEDTDTYISSEKLSEEISKKYGV